MRSLADVPAATTTSKGTAVHVGGHPPACASIVMSHNVALLSFLRLHPSVDQIGPRTHAMHSAFVVCTSLRTLSSYELCVTSRNCARVCSLCVAYLRIVRFQESRKTAGSKHSSVPVGWQYELVRARTSATLIEDRTRQQNGPRFQPQPASRGARGCHASGRRRRQQNDPHLCS